MTLIKSSLVVLLLALTIKSSYGMMREIMNDPEVQKAFGNACQKVKTDDKATQVFDCTKTPDEVKTFMKKCMEKLGKDTSDGAAKRLNRMCTMMEKIKTLKTAEEKGGKKDGKDGKEKKENPMMKSKIPECTPDEKVKTAMGAHQKLLSSPEGKKAMVECVNKAAA